MVFGKILLVLMSLERTVRRAAKTGKPIKTKEGRNVVYYDFQTAQRINKDYAAMTKSLEKTREKADEQTREKTDERPTMVKLLGAAVENTVHIAKNAVDNTIGYPIAVRQNHQTAKYLKNHPNTGKYVVELIPGLFQNIGSQHRYARSLRERGHLPHHIRPNNGQPESERVARMEQQIDSLEKKTKASPYRVISGHSDGAGLAIKFVQGYEGRDRVSKYNVKGVQARAPTPHGMYQTRTLGQKLLIPFAPNDNVKKSLAARKGAVHNERAKPYTDVHVVAGEYDGLVTPADAVYQPKQGKGRVHHYLMRGKHSTHFRTAGGDATANKQMGAHIDDMVKTATIGLRREGSTGQYTAESDMHYKKAA